MNHLKTFRIANRLANPEEPKNVTSHLTNVWYDDTTDSYNYTLTFSGSLDGGFYELQCRFSKGVTKDGNGLSLIMMKPPVVTLKVHNRLVRDPVEVNQYLERIKTPKFMKNYSDLENSAKDQIAREYTQDFDSNHVVHYDLFDIEMV